jgi:hypothetical protein
MTCIVYCSSQKLDLKKRRVEAANESGPTQKSRAPESSDLSLRVPISFNQTSTPDILPLFSQFLFPHETKQFQTNLRIIMCRVIKARATRSNQIKLISMQSIVNNQLIIRRARTLLGGLETASGFGLALFRGPTNTQASR